MMESYPTSIPLTEKYRPINLHNIVSQPSIVKILFDCVSHNRLPHMLFYGPPGTGKTSCILALSREYYGHDLYKNMILELNGSDDRGINVIRTLIKNFAKLKNVLCPNKPKIIILDEADSLTQDAQFALRRVIEKFTNNVRFCLLCNYINKVIPAIQSRCLVLKFSCISFSDMRNRVCEIVINEHMEIQQEIIDMLCQTTKGDFRRALNFLQQRRFLKKHVVEYFYGVSLNDFETCEIILQKQDNDISQHIATLQHIVQDSRCTFDTLIQIFQQLGIKNRKYSFLNELGGLEFKYYASNHCMENIFIYALATILSDLSEKP